MIAVSDTVWSVIGAAPVSFALGVLVGFLLSNRYRVTRRDGKGASDG